MKLTLVLDPAEGELRASLVEEWEDMAGTQKMAPRIRHFDSEEAALAWGRGLARRRGLQSLYLIDNRKRNPL
jgi:hypothetical protein